MTEGGDRMDPMKDEEVAVTVIAIEVSLLQNPVTEVMVEDIRIETGTKVMVEDIRMETGGDLEMVEVAVGVNTRTVPITTVVAEEDIADTIALVEANGTDEVMRDVGIDKVMSRFLDVGH